MTNYEEFLGTKFKHHESVGFDAEPSTDLFPFQRDLVIWALRRGRCAIFASTGLGKSRMQLTWAHHVAEHTGLPVLILAPLAVARQTVAEGAKVGIVVTLCRDASDVCPGINVTNYDRVHLFDASVFGGIVCDESSILKHSESKTRAQLTEAFGATPFKLCCTATPSPNDYMELGSHAEFLGICSQSEMLAEFFVHGCFWHRHAGCALARLPKTRHDFWVPKLEANRGRDEKNLARLQSEGWKVLVIWECELGDLASVTNRVEQFLKEPS